MLSNKVSLFENFERVNFSINSSLFKDVTILQGWVIAIRVFKKRHAFLKLSDGSIKSHPQVYIPKELMTRMTDVKYGTCVRIEGEMVESIGPDQDEELLAKKIDILGKCDADEFPFHMKDEVKPDNIREHLHLRPKTEYMQSMLRVRNTAFMAIHNYFQLQGYLYINTPILTSNDCEGAGETFTIQRVKGVNTDGTDQEFFGKPVHLTVSGQLHLEAITGGIHKCYTVSPTFRAEKSHSRHHLAEFSMVEAEMAFTSSLEDIMTVMEELIKSVTMETVNKANKDIEYLHNINSVDMKSTADVLLNNKYERLSYTDAVKIVSENKEFSSFKWGEDFSKANEKYIVKKCGDIPVFVTDYPAILKPFYARVNDDSSTVSAVDLLLPDVGELFGGSLREERYDVLQEKLTKEGLLEKLNWYLDIRKYGSAPHGGFGMGFDRYLQFLVNMSTVRDTCPFPRYHLNCKM